MADAVGTISENPSVGKIVRRFDLSGSVLERARNYLVAAKTLFSSQRIDMVRNWRKIDRAYRCNLETDRKFKGFDDRASAIIHTNVEMIVSRIAESVFSFQPDDMANVQSDSLKDEIKILRNRELNFQIEKTNLTKKGESVARTATKFGTSFIACEYLSDEHKILTQQIVIGPNGMPTLQLVPQIDRKYQGPGYEVINDIEDIYADPFIEDIQKQPIVIRRVIVDREHLDEGVRKGIYLQKQVDLIKDRNFSSTSIETSSRRSEEILGTTRTFFDSTKNMDGRPKTYEMFVAYCDFSVPTNLDDGGTEERTYKCVIYVVGDTCIGVIPNPYYHQMTPIIKVVYERVEGEFYGIPAVNNGVLSAYNQYNDLMNQANDCRVLSVNPIVITRAGGTSDKQDLKVYPGMIWQERSPGDIRFAEFPQGTVSRAEETLELFEQRINRGMGITPLMQGVGDNTDLDNTWRGTNKLISQADKKFKLIAAGIESAAVKEWAEMAYKINVQYNPIMVMPNQFEHINSEMVFTVSGVENYFDRMEKVQQIQMILGSFSSIPGLNVVGLLKYLLDLIDIKYDESAYGPIYYPPPPPKAEPKAASTTVSIPLDPSKGAFSMLAMCDWLAKKEDIKIDLDRIRVAQEIIKNDNEQVKDESGILPPKDDSYP